MVGGSNCSLCVQGTYGTGLGMMILENCSLCDAGSYQTGMGMSRNIDCVLCDRGTYATGLGIVSNQDCGFCGAGTFQTGSGMQTASNCSLCVQGTYQTGRGMMFETNCTLCIAGTYQTGAGQVDLSDCTLCGLGQYQTGTGLTSLHDCNACMAGKYQTGSGMAAETDCTLCGPGKYQTGDLMRSENECSLCGQGTYQTGSGMISARNCSLCRAGTYQTGSGMVEVGNCSLCVQGSYGTGSGMVAIANCTLCKEDTYNPDEGSEASFACRPCPNSTITYGLNGSKNILDCGCDQFHYKVKPRNNLSSILTCELCPMGALCDSVCSFNSYFSCSSKIEGLWTLNQAGVFVLTGCNPGFSLRSTNKTGSEYLQRCEPCASNDYIVNPDTDDCQMCPLGGGPQALTDANAACSASPKIVLGATWTLVLDHYRLTSCPTGHRISLNMTVGWASQYCDPCMQGYECVSANCTTCNACAPGKYKDSQGTSACTACDVNTYNPDNGSTSRASCLTCPCLSTTLGEEGIASEDHCICNIQYYKVTLNGISNCQTCPKGAVCTAGATCALASPPAFLCPSLSEGNASSIIGTWKLDTSSGKYVVVDCPAGYTLMSTSIAGSEDLQECKACINPSQYILHPTDGCQSCPPGLRCYGNEFVEPVVENSTWQRNGSIYRLLNCPAGFQVYSSSSDPTTQQCMVCGAGLECPLAPCVTCSSCLPGHYKTVEGTSPCQACPADTYGTTSGGQIQSIACIKCPANSNTENLLGQNSVSACICNEGYYLDDLNTSESKGQCLSCPAGATCPGGVAPIFGQALQAQITLGVSAEVFCCNKNTEAHILSSLAASLGIAVSALSVQSPCSGVQCRNRRASRPQQHPSAVLESVLRYLVNGNEQKSPGFASSPTWSIRDAGLQIQFTAIVSATQASALSSSSFAQTFSALSNISLTVLSSQSIGSIDSAGQVYGPVNAQGQYPLLGCRVGYILVNDSVATQSCTACTEGTYSLNPMDGCGSTGICSQRSVCQQCPSGLSCPGLAAFTPTVKGSVWIPEFDTSTSLTILHLIECPPGYLQH